MKKATLIAVLTLCCELLYGTDFKLSFYTVATWRQHEGALSGISQPLVSAPLELEAAFPAEGPLAYLPFFRTILVTTFSQGQPYFTARTSLGGGTYIWNRNSEGFYVAVYPIYDLPVVVPSGAFQFSSSAIDLLGCDFTLTPFPVQVGGYWRTVVYYPQGALLLLPFELGLKLSVLLR